MVAKTSKVKASYGKWSYKRKDGDIVEFTGTFPPDCASDAFGTSSFLHRSHITDTDTQPRPPEKFSDGYVVRLRADWGDNMFKFENWALHHGLLPKLEAELEAQKQTHLESELLRRESSKLAFKPAPEAFMRSAVTHMHWELHEAGYANLGEQRSNEALVASTTNPALAFQVGYYLLERGYIEQRQFDHLNDDIKAQRASRGRDNEYRIAVHGRQISRFETDFPQLGNGQVMLDKAWLDELQMHSAPSVIPTR